MGSVMGMVEASGWDKSEFYLYDVYGQPRGESAAGNPYYFTARRVDYYDNIPIQHNRNRHYDYELGRWMQTDPLGVRIASLDQDSFYDIYPPDQYIDGLSLYEYVGSGPTNWIDTMGTFKALTDPVLEPDYQRIYYTKEITIPGRNTGMKKFLWGRGDRTETISGYAFVDWQYLVMETKDIEIMGRKAGSGEMDSGPLIRTWGLNWKWPDQPPGPRRDNLCRQWVKCKCQCCGGPLGRAIWEVEWKPTGVIIPRLLSSPAGGKLFGPGFLYGSVRPAEGLSEFGFYCNVDELTQVEVDDFCDKDSANIRCKLGYADYVRSRYE